MQTHRHTGLLVLSDTGLKCGIERYKAVVTVCTTLCNTQKLCISAYGFSMILRINSHYFQKLH
jgi:hypothetical protein